MAKCTWCGKYCEEMDWQFQQTFCSLKCGNEYNKSGYNLSEKEGCFIATAVYGDYNHPAVLDLRSFRDMHLKNSAIGRKFISQYYNYGPKLAKVISKHNILKRVTYFLVVKPIHQFVKLANLK